MFENVFILCYVFIKLNYKRNLSSKSWIKKNRHKSKVFIFIVGLTNIVILSVKECAENFIFTQPDRVATQNNVKSYFLFILKCVYDKIFKQSLA